MMVNVNDNVRHKVKDTDSVDKSIGEKITLLRTIMGVSRQHLADQIGVTHQQLHKYEKAINRISVGRLVAVAKALEVEISYFFEDIDGSITEEQLKKQKACMALVRDFIKIEDEEHREAVKSLIRSLTKHQEQTN